MRIWSRLRERLGKTPADIPDEPVTYLPIGVVRNSVRKPRPDGWEDIESEVALREELTSALEGIEGFSHVIVVFHMDRVPEEEKRLRVRVGNEDDPPERGVLATRSQRRPNAIATSVVALLGREGSRLQVRGLDAIDGTPVLDVKPYLPQYDSVPGAQVPGWAQRRE